MNKAKNFIEEQKKAVQNEEEILNENEILGLVKTKTKNLQFLLYNK